ncbi:MAG: hypothetical protein AAFQ82_24240, partial [Myxococcota bacterium]
SSPLLMGARSVRPRAMARFKVQDRTLRELQWPGILEALSLRARTPLGVEGARELPFLDEREAI